MDITTDTLLEHLHAVIGPREHTSKEAEQHLQQVENYIFDQLEAYGWTMQRQRFSFDELTTAWGRVVKHKSGTNIIAEKQGKSDKVLIIATHHDTVQRSPGADDNGTGIAGLLEIARYFISKENYYTLRLVSFDLEEEGLLGSEWYVQNLDDEERDRIKGMIMLEMLGYYSDNQYLPRGFGMLYRKEIKRLREDDGELRGDFLSCIYREGADFIVEAFDQTTGENKLKVAKIRDAVDLPAIGTILNKVVPSLQNLLRSDHTPFWFRKIPAVMLTDTANFRNPHYHKSSDTIDTLDMTRFLQAVERIIEVIVKINENASGFF